ncbi:MAG: hypothetical protein HXY43_25985 [Fischerella sp.]|jgi:hypothetical protein|uniref:hypothetical protein n=1 Tax=Fischerella sp. TaxID=1191 RepID=UPI00178EB23F|nr:hypothetical protein [Fischerella sp.]NWF62589.1 hypothetical protein [Fischerella sp.]
MFEQGDFDYHLDKSGFESEAQKTAKAFISGVNRFYIKIIGEFSLFCEFFCLDPTDPTSFEKFYQFVQLARAINNIDLEELTQMIDAGWKLGNDRAI